MHDYLDNNYSAIKLLSSIYKTGIDQFIYILIYDKQITLQLIIKLH